MIVEELKDKYFYKNNNLTPYGYKVWTLLLNAIKDKFASLGYKEGFYFSNIYDEEIFNEDKIQMGNIIKNNQLIHGSISSSIRMIEGAKTLTIDILQAYISICKSILGINLITGKRVLFDDREIYTIGMLSKDNKFIEVGKVSYLGYINNSYKVTSEFSSRILEGLSFTSSDEKGLIISPLGAPIQIGIVPLKINEAKVISSCKELMDRLNNLNYRVDLNLSNISDQEKLDKYIEMGVPIIIEMGPRDIQNNQIELIKRSDLKTMIVDNSRLDAILSNAIKRINVDIYNTQIKQVLLNTININSIEELNESIKANKICNIMWNGENEEYNKILNLNPNAKMFLPFNQELFYDQSLITKTKSKYVLTIINSL